MKRFIHILLLCTFFRSAWTQNPRATVSEGVLVGKTVQFSENRFINKTVDVDLFLVSTVKDTTVLYPCL